MNRYRKTNLSLFKWGVIFTLLTIPALGATTWNYEVYSQTVFLKKFDNVVTQNRVIALNSFEDFQFYGGLWWEGDQKTGPKEAFTDSQLSPLAGIQSRLVGSDWLYSRLFFEGRFVHRTTSFPDDRERSAYEVRAGALGYGLWESEKKLFLENYYALFYTRLYGDRLIFQGWSKQGARIGKHFDIFNEVFVDTFDLTRDSDASFDLRPGLRASWRFSQGTVQLMHQWLHHFSNLEFSGRNEQRTTLVFGLYL